MSILKLYSLHKMDNLGTFFSPYPSKDSTQVSALAIRVDLEYVCMACSSLVTTNALYQAFYCHLHSSISINYFKLLFTSETRRFATETRRIIINSDTLPDEICTGNHAIVSTI